MSNVIKLRSKPKLYSTGSLTETEYLKNVPNPIDELLQREQELKAQYQKGYNEGYQQAKAKLENEYTNELIRKSEEFYAILSSFEEKLNGYDTIYDEAVVRLALQIAEKIVKHEIQNKSSILDSLRESIKKVIGANEVVIKLHPDDLAMLNNEGHSSIIDRQFNKIKFEISDKITPGGCMIETDLGNVDARIESQLDEISRKLEEVFAKKSEL